MDRYSYEDTRIRMAHTARNVGLFAFLFSIILGSIPFISVILGALAIVLAILSKGPYEKMLKEAKNAVYTGLMGIVIGVGVLAFTVYNLLNNSDYRNQVLEYADMLYGQEYQDIYGGKPSDIVNQFIGGFSK